MGLDPPPLIIIPGDTDKCNFDNCNVIKVELEEESEEGHDEEPKDNSSATTSSLGVAAILSLTLVLFNN